MFKQCNSSKRQKIDICILGFCFNKFYGEMFVGFCLNTAKRFFLELLFYIQDKGLRFPQKTGLGIFKIALRFKYIFLIFFFFFFFSFYKAFYNKLNTKLVINKKEVCIKRQNFYWLSCNDQHKKLKQKNRVIYIEQLKIYSYCMKFLRFVTDL